MNKYIGFDKDSKRTVRVQYKKGGKDTYMGNGQASRWSPKLEEIIERSDKTKMASAPPYRSPCHLKGLSS